MIPISKKNASNLADNFAILLLKMNFMPCPFTGPKMFCAGPNFDCI